MSLEKPVYLWVKLLLRRKQSQDDDADDDDEGDDDVGRITMHCLKPNPLLDFPLPRFLKPTH